MDETTLASIRRRNFRALIDAGLHGSQAEIARRVKRPGSQIGDMLAGRKAFGEKVARSLEERLGIPRGILDADQVHSAVASGGGSEYPTVSDRVDLGGRDAQQVTAGRGYHSVPLLTWADALECAMTTQFPETTDHQYFRCPVPCSSRTYVLRVESSEPAVGFFRGMLLFVDPDERPMPDDYVIAALPAHTTPALRQVSIDGGRLYLRSVTALASDVREPVGDDARILGVVVFRGESLRTPSP